MDWFTRIRAGIAALLLWVWAGAVFVYQTTALSTFLNDAIDFPKAVEGALVWLSGTPSWVPLILAILLTAWAIAPRKMSEIPRSRAEPDENMVPLHKAGLWLYEHGSPTIKTHLRAMVPSVFDTIAQHGAAFFVEAARAGVGQLYGRREQGLPLERMTADEVDTTAINPLFEEGDRRGHPIDLAVERRDLRKVLRWYENDEAERKGRTANRVRTTAAPSAAIPQKPSASRLPTAITNGLWELHFKSTHPGARKTITFLPDGTVGEGRNQNEHTWKLEQDILTITRADGSLQNRFAFNPTSDRLVSINDTSAVGNPNQTIYRP